MRTSRIQEIISEIALSNAVDLTVVGARLDLHRKGYMPLVIETIDEQRVQIAFHYEENGDIVPNPCITFIVVSTGWVPIDKAEPLTGFKSYAYTAGGKIILTDLRGQHDLANFADQWADAIRIQDWLHKAQVTVSGPAEAILTEEELIPF